MDARGSRLADVVPDDHRPVAERDVLEPGERVDGGADVPDGLEVARRLALERGRYPGDVRRVVPRDLGDEGKVVGEHGTSLSLVDSTTARAAPRSARSPPRSHAWRSWWSPPARPIVSGSASTGASRRAGPARGSR